jgi:hypothetical protein
MSAALDDLSNEDAASVYERFVEARPAALVVEIWRACGITAPAAGRVEEVDLDEVAADVKDGTAPIHAEVDEFQPEAV